MLKKFLFFLICSVFLSGCTVKKQEEITFSSWGSVTEVQVLKQIISDFEKDNSNIKVKFIHIPQNYFQKIHLLFASNTAPDVIFINNLYLPIYASQLENLTDKIKISEFYPQAIDCFTYENKILAIPRDISNLVFFINTDIIKSPSKDWSIEDLLKISLEAKKQEKFGISFEEDFYWTLPYLTYFGEDFNKKDSEGLKFYKELRDKYKVAPTKSQIGSSTLAQMFINGKIAMYLSGRWMYPKISEKATFNWEVINFPYGKTFQPCDGSGWAISKNSKHKESALKFVEYLSRNESAEYFAKTGLIVPARINASKLLNNTKHNEKVFLEVINNSKKTFVTKDYKKLTDKFNLENF